MMNAVNCYVELHGYGYVEAELNQPPPLDWLSAVAVNGVSVMNLAFDSQTGKQGIYTFNVDPGNCRASDGRHFNTYQDATASINLTTYLEALAHGRLAIYSYTLSQKKIDFFTCA